MAINDLQSEFPCLFPKLVPSEQVEFNEYNPNCVAPHELKLLIHSIEEDGVTQPIVTIYDDKRDKYIVVDGEHRYKVLTKVFNLPQIPIVVINKNIKQRMASTIRHNRARGEHTVDGMSNIVAELFTLGWTDKEIGNHLGMEPDEVLRLKQITGIAEIFKDREYSEAWEA